MSGAAPGAHGDVQRARALMGMGRWDEAGVELRRAIGADPSNADAWCNLGHVELRRYDAGAALNAADRAMALAPASDWPLRLRAVALSRLGRHQEALGAAGAAVGLAPNSVAAHDVASEVAVFAGETALAQFHAELLCQLAPDSARGHQLLAKVALRRRRSSEAEGHARRALELDPENPDTLTDLALALIGRKRKLAAAAALDHAIAIEPTWERTRRLQKLVAQFSNEARIVVGLIGVIGVAGVAGLGDPDPYSRRAARVLVGVVIGMLVLVAGIWVRRRQRLPPSARAVLRKHRQGRRTAIAQGRSLIVCAMVAVVGLMALLGWFTDPNSWDAGGWITMGLVAAITAWCLRMVLRWRRAGRHRTGSGEVDLVP